MRCLSLFGIALLSLALLACSAPGAFFGAPDGVVFREHTASDGNHALVYLYRPQSDWADQELEAPGLFIDNQRVGSLPGNGYLVLELAIASYRLEMRRPLFGSYWTLFAEGPLDFTRIAGFTLDTEAGGVYYLRYDELSPPASSDGATHAGDGPLHLVSAASARDEISRTRKVQPLQRIAADSATERVQRGFWRGLGRMLDTIGI